MTDIDRLLNTTSAGLLAQKLNAMDGNAEDKQISASIWNEFVKDKGGKEVREFISLEDAMKSITTYVIREAKKAGKSVNDLMKEWNSAAPAPGGSPAPAAPTAPAETTPTAPVSESEETPPTNPTPPAEVEATQQEKIRQDYESVKVTVPKITVTAKKPENKAEIDKIINSRKEGKKVADQIKQAFNALTPPFGPGDVDKAEEALKLINKDNVAYVLAYIPNLVDRIDGIDAFGYGFDKDEVIKYVLTPLGLKGDEYGWGYDKEDGSRGKLSEYYNNNAKDLSLDDIKSNLAKVSKDIRQEDSAKIKNYNDKMTAYSKNVNEVKNYNKTERPKIQKVFDDATKFMAEVANMEPKPEIEKNDNSATAKLPDGRYIQVSYNDDGKISDVLISHDTTPDHNSDGTTSDGTEVDFDKDKAFFDTDKSNFQYEGHITSGYDFEKLKALAEKIFGKKE